MVNSLVAAVLLISIFSPLAKASPEYSVKLERVDSLLFLDVIKGFNAAKSVSDPQRSDIRYEKIWYSSANGAVTIGCVSTYKNVAITNSECRLVFIPQLSSSEAQVTVDPRGTVMAVLNDRVTATKFYKNLGMSPYETNERVSQASLGPHNIPRLRIDCARAGSGGESNRCMINAVMEVR